MKNCDMLRTDASCEATGEKIGSYNVVIPNMAFYRRAKDEDKNDQAIYSITGNGKERQISLSLLPRLMTTDLALGQNTIL